MENVPVNISKRMKATWGERISGILASYENYTRIVCGDFQSPNPSWVDHDDKWFKFKHKLILRREVLPNYCVHY